MAIGLALVVLLLLAVASLLWVYIAGLRWQRRADAELLTSCFQRLQARDSVIASLRASHDEVQDIALKALRGDYDRATERRTDR